MKVRRIDFSPDEYLAGIAGMGAEDQGMFWLICSLIYSTGGPIQIDDQRLISLSGCHGNKRNAIIARLTNSQKIIRNGSEIGQKRCGNELEKAEKRSREGSENAAKRWNSNGLDNGTPYGPRNANHQPSTTNHHLSARVRARGFDFLGEGSVESRPTEPGTFGPPTVPAPTSFADVEVQPNGKTKAVRGSD